MTELSLSTLDRDEALAEAIAELYGQTRADFLRGTAFGGAAMLAALAAPANAAAQVSDLQILNFGLRFERLQATFYTEAESIGTIRRMPADKQRWARRIFKKVLGRRAERRPFFDFGDATGSDGRFTRTAVAMEDLTVALLAGVTPRVQNRGLTAALFGLLTTEARHAAWARHIVGTTPAAEAFDEPRTLSDVRGVVARTRFIVQRPSTSRRRRPRFTG
jgi:hypothetical protein